MSIFRKADPPPTKPRERAAPPSRVPQGDAAISIIGSGMNVVGDIRTEGIVRIEGSVQGTINAGKAVVLGQSGTVDGNIITEDAVIGGTVTGAILATNRLELQSTCTVDGEIRTRPEHLKLEEGARFTGKVQMLDEEGDGAPEILPVPERAAVTESAVKETPSAFSTTPVEKEGASTWNGQESGEADLVPAGNKQGSEGEAVGEDGGERRKKGDSKD